MLADDVAAADGVKADLFRRALAGFAMATVARDVADLALERLRHDFAQLERRAGRRVDLVAVVRFDDLDVVALAEDLRRGFGELVGGVHAHREIRRHHDRHALRRRGDGLSLRWRKAGGADHHRARVLEIGERAFGTREIDQHVARRGSARIGGDLDVALRAGGDVEGGTQLQLAIGEHGIDEGAPHPAAGAGERHFRHMSHRPAAGETTSPSMRASLP